MKQTENLMLLLCVFVVVTGLNNNLSKNLACLEKDIKRTKKRKWVGLEESLNLELVIFQISYLGFSLLLNR